MGNFRNYRIPDGRNEVARDEEGDLGKKKSAEEFEEGLGDALLEVEEPHDEGILREVKVAELWHALHVAIGTHQLVGSREALTPATTVTACGERLLVDAIDIQWLIDTGDGTGSQEAAGQEVGVLAVAFAGETQVVGIQELATEQEANGEGDKVQEEVTLLGRCEVASFEHGIAMHLSVTLAATILELAVGQVK